MSQKTHDSHKANANSQSKQSFPLHVLVIILIISLLTGSVLFVLFIVANNSVDINNRSAESICEEFNVQDNDFERLSSIEGSASITDEDGTIDLNLFEVSALGFEIAQEKYIGDTTVPYPNWTNLFLSIVWLSDGPVEDEQYVEARAPYLGIFNASYNDARKMSVEEFSQRVLCSQRQLARQEVSSGYTSLEQINQDIEDTQTRSDQENLEFLDQELGRDSAEGSFNEDANIPDEYESFYSKLYQGLYEQLPALLDDIEGVGKFDSINEYFEDLAMQRFGEVNQLVEHELQRLDLEYSHDGKKLYSIGDDKLLVFGQNYDIETDLGTQESYLLLRDLDENSLDWFLPNYYVCDIIVRDTIITALAYDAFESQSEPNSAEILTIDTRTGDILNIIEDSPSDDFTITDLVQIDPSSDELFATVQFDSDDGVENHGLYDIVQESIVYRYQQNYQNYSDYSSISPNQQYLAVISETGAQTDYGDTEIVILLADITTGQTKVDTTIADGVINWATHRMRVSNTGEVEIYYNSADYELELADRKIVMSLDQGAKIIEGEYIQEVASFNSQREHGIITRDNRYIVRAIDYGDVAVFKQNPNGQFEMHKTLSVPEELQGFNDGMAFSSDEEVLLLSSRYGQIHVFDYK